MLRTGRTPFGRWDNTPPPAFKLDTYLKCTICQCEVDYQPCYAHHAGIHCVEVKKSKWNYGKFHFAPEVGLVIFDEVHKCNSFTQSCQSDMLSAVRRDGKKFLGLSATAACSPLQMRALGYTLGLHDAGDSFWSFLRRYGCGRIEGLPGIHFKVGEDKQGEMMRKLHADLFPAHGVRIRWTDVPGFPERVVTPELYDLSGAEGRLDALYAEMAEAVEALKHRKEQDADADHPLTKQLRARQEIELLKVPMAVEAANESLDKGHSVSIFVNFTQTLNELRKRLKCDCIIDGSPEGVKRREKSISDYQQDRSRLILVNYTAGGASWSGQDLFGNYPRMSYGMPPVSAVVYRQWLGRFHRDGGKSPAFYRVLLAARTKEEQIYKKLVAKGNNMDALNDGDFMVDN